MNQSDVKFFLLIGLVAAAAFGAYALTKKRSTPRKARKNGNSEKSGLSTRPRREHKTLTSTCATAAKNCVADKLMD